MGHSVPSGGDLGEQAPPGGALEKSTSIFKRRKKTMVQLLPNTSGDEGDSAYGPTDVITVHVSTETNFLKSVYFLRKDV